MTILGPRESNGWYRIERLPDLEDCMRTEANSLSAENQIKRERIMQLHRDLGHASKNKLALILATGQINGLTVR